MRRSVRVVLAFLLAGALVAAGCTSDDGGDGSAGDPDGSSEDGDDVADGLIPEDEWRARQDDYLAWATAQGDIDGGHIDAVLAALEWSERDDGYEFDPATLDPADLAETFEKLENFDDTGDFDINNFLHLLAGYGDQLPEDYRSALEERILAFKYWWTEPTPEGITDSQYYFTENHLIIFLANEYIAGQMFPDEVFTNSGMTGREHMEHAETRIRTWIDLRARFGYSEWLSNVYFMEDMKGLLLLAEHSDDPELATLSSMALDLLLVEMAAHTQAGAFGATHGRSYMKDKMTALDEDNFTLSKMLFDDTEYDYQHVDNASLLAVADRYRPPEVVRRIAASEGADEIRQRQSIPIDYLGPVTEDPEAPFGLTYEGEEGVMTWWAIGAMFAWPVVPLSIETIETNDLWESDLFQRVADLRPIIEASTMPELQALSVQLGRQFNAGLSSEVNSYTWRQPEVMLSTAQCWRPGDRSEQAHIWQATLDANAQVFTTHPREPVPDSTDWHTNSGYWTGEGTTPCSAQYLNVNVSVYAPAYGSNDDREDFHYEQFTHAYFPTEHFDEVVEVADAGGRGGWVIGRKGDGYVALWSLRPTEWREYDPATEPTNGMTEPFDLLAPGGPENVWITEVGRSADWPDAEDPFQAFVDAISAAEIQVIGPQVDCPATAECEVPLLHDAENRVTYESPTLGTVVLDAVNTTTDADAALTVAGQDVGLTGYPRHSTPWSRADMNTYRYEIEADGWTLTLDFEAATRTTAAP
jgi:hypothetical protein